jgi:hypothetical protein
LEGRDTDVVDLGVEDDFLRVGRYGHHFDVSDEDALFDVIVIDEVEALAGHSQLVVVLAPRRAEVVDVDYIQKDLLGFHPFADLLYAFLVHLLIIINQKPIQQHNFKANNAAISLLFLFR